MSDSSQESYFLDQESSPSEEVKPRRQPAKRQPRPETSEGRWSEEESIKYALFIDCHASVFSSKEKRKASKIFVTLASFLGTRTPRQCRSHFQKLMTRFRRINKIRAHFQGLLGPLEYARRIEEVGAMFRIGNVSVSVQTEAPMAEEHQVLKGLMLEPEIEKLMLELQKKIRLHPKLWLPLVVNEDLSPVERLSTE